jgi:mono/diheme cytochrome c family protein
MKISIVLKGITLGSLSVLAAIGMAVAAGGMFRPNASATPGSAENSVLPVKGAPERQGYALFVKNCAHCHGNDARGDEGPDLHGVAKSDARIASIIKNGVKGEMPKFGAKLDDSEIPALVAFVRSMRD